MTNRERENATLSFAKDLERGAVAETFFPWDLTAGRWQWEGLPPGLADHLYPEAPAAAEAYLDCLMTAAVYQFEQFFGFDGVKRISFKLPFLNYPVEEVEATAASVVRQDKDGWLRRYYRDSELVEEIKPVVSDEADWRRLKERAVGELERYYSDANIRRIYDVYRAGQQRGDYSVRLNIGGFFWTPRELLGIEGHLLAFYDNPEMLHDMNEFILEVYRDRLGRVLDILPADVLYIMEDLSGVNGPMLSPALFDEFVGAYYRRLVPLLKEKGVRHVLVDTDGDFTKLIPNFIRAGIEGFLPMDVNAGMDIVAVRQSYPDLKFIGGFNKLAIAAGPEAVDAEFARLLPVIRQGGYIPGCDHQVAPSTALADYLYYVDRLKEVMREAGRG